MQENNISTGNFEQCQKCSLCETVCPVMANNPDYGGPKRSGPDGQRYRLKNGIFYDDSLKYCLNCKRCEVACPSGVRIADLIQQARIEFSQKSPKLRDVMLASTDQMGPLASAVAPIVNFSLGLAPVKGLLDLTIGLDHRRTLPKYSSETFVHWFNKNAASKQDSYKKHISYFHGCYANYNYPQLAKDFVAVMNAFGYGVHLIEGERCCGVAKIVNENYVREGQIVIDVGMNVDNEGKLCGDVDYDKVSEIAEAVTPVPGGVGSITTAILLKHVVVNAERQA